MLKKTDFLFLIFLFFSALKIQAFEQTVFQEDQLFLGVEENFRTDDYEFLGIIQIEVSGKTYFTDLCFRDSRCFLLDAAGCRVIIYENSRVAGLFNIPGSGKCHSIYTEQSGVIDVIRGEEIYRFDQFGNLIVSIGNGRGKNIGFLFEPSFLTVDRDGYMYVTDTGNSRIQIFNHKRKAVYEITGTYADFTAPAGITSDSSGRLIVTDISEDRVLYFSDSGKLTGLKGKTGNSSWEFNYPSKILTDRLDNYYILDRFNHRVQKFLKNDQFVTEIRGKVSGKLKSPRSFAIDNSGEIWLIDSASEKIWRFGSAFFERGRALYISGNYSDAVPLLKKAVRSRADNQFAFYYLAWISFFESDYQQSAEYLKQAFQINPDSRCGIFAEQQLAQLYRWYNIKKE